MADDGPELIESSTSPLSPRGETWIRRIGGKLVQSIDGGAFVPMGAAEVIATVSGAAVQDIDVTGLAGDTDGDYAFYAQLIFTAAGTCLIQPNLANPSVAQTTGLNVVAAGTVNGLAEVAGLQIISVGVGGTVLIEGTLTSKSGRNRFGRCNAFLAAGAMWHFTYSMGDNATVFTSLRFHGNSAGLFNTNSYVRLVKLGHST